MMYIGTCSCFTFWQLCTGIGQQGARPFQYSSKASVVRLFQSGVFLNCQAIVISLHFILRVQTHTYSTYDLAGDTKPLFWYSGSAQRGSWQGIPGLSKNSSEI